jgi:S-DNA-T family DNA segregation ATPase FtsK/SpoIIIE
MVRRGGGRSDCGVAGPSAHRPNTAGRPALPMQLELSADILTAALRAAGLVKADATPQLVTPPLRDGHGWAVTLDLPRGGGKTAADAIAKRDTVAAELGVDEIQVIMSRVRAVAGGHAGRLMIWVADDDPYIGPPHPSPLIGLDQFSVWEPIPFGRDARGRRIALVLIWQSMFFGGLPGEAKHSPNDCRPPPGCLTPTCGTTWPMARAARTGARCARWRTGWSSAPKTKPSAPFSRCSMS